MGRFRGEKYLLDNWESQLLFYISLVQGGKHNIMFPVVILYIISHLEIKLNFADHGKQGFSLTPAYPLRKRSRLLKAAVFREKLAGSLE